MKRYYITADKLGEFVARMYAAGIKVDCDPKEEQITLKKPDGSYEWIHIFNKGSFDDLCAAFLPKSDEPNTLG